MLLLVLRKSLIVMMEMTKSLLLRRRKIMIRRKLRTSRPSYEQKAKILSLQRRRKIRVTRIRNKTSKWSYDNLDLDIEPNSFIKWLKRSVRKMMVLNGCLD